jgi:primary-amine oxidase
MTFLQTESDIAEPPVTSAHPLDPLSADEMRRAGQILRTGQALSDSFRFAMMSLHEPDKPASLSFDSAPAPDREAFIVAHDLGAKMLWEAVVSLTRGQVLSWTHIPDRMPPFLPEDPYIAEDIIREDPQWQAAMLKRGITDFSLAMIDNWPSGYYGPEDHPSTSARLSRPLTWLRTSPEEHGYARPVDGVIVTFDMDERKVIDVTDLGVVSVPPNPGNYIPELMFDPANVPAYDRLRTDVKPIDIVQPEGASFTVDGWGVAWQKWRLRVAFNPREGLVLHQISYDDRGTVRPVVYRASLSEMVVPYGDASATQWNKNVFDMGEVGMGMMANSLTLGCDCLGEIYYFDGVVNDSFGEPVIIKNAVCMHEEDVGIAWKHTDVRTGTVEVRRNRRLVISSIATVGNYEYGFYWYLYTDGTIEYDIKLTGVLTTGAVEDGVKPRWGALVAPGLYGPNHQHFFNVRMDMCVDGPNNSVIEVDSIPEPDPALNPHHNAWITRSTLLESEAAAGRDVDPSTARFWKVINPAVINDRSEPVAYKVMIGTTAPSMLQPGSAIYDRAAFVRHNLWVTAYDREQMYASGRYPYQCPEAQGLPEYIADDASVINTDVVIWVTVGAHHIVRPEDWPVMPVTHAGFELKPVGFFDGNPALDLPRSAQGTSCHTGHCA